MTTHRCLQHDTVARVHLRQLILVLQDMKPGTIFTTNESKSYIKCTKSTIFFQKTINLVVQLLV